MAFNMCCYLISNTHEHNFTLQALPLTCFLCMLVLFRFFALIIPSRPSAFIARGLISCLDSSGLLTFLVLFPAPPPRPADEPLPPFAPRAPNPDCISRQAPRPVANKGLKIWRRLRSESRGGGGALCRWWQRRERAAAIASYCEDRGGGRRELSTGRRGEACEGRLESRGPCCPDPAANHRPLSDSSGCAATPPSLHLPCLPHLPQPSSSPFLARPGPAVALFRARRHGRGIRCRGNLARGFHAA